MVASVEVVVAFENLVHNKFDDCLSFNEANETDFHSDSHHAVRKQSLVHYGLVCFLLDFFKFNAR